MTCFCKFTCWIIYANIHIPTSISVSEWWYSAELQCFLCFTYPLHQNFVIAFRTITHGRNPRHLHRLTNLITSGVLQCWHENVGLLSFLYLSESNCYGIVFPLGKRVITYPNDLVMIEMISHSPFEGLDATIPAAHPTSGMDKSVLMPAQVFHQVYWKRVWSYVSQLRDHDRCSLLTLWTLEDTDQVIFKEPKADA